MEIKNVLLLTDAYNLSHGFLKQNADYETSHIYNRNKPCILYGFNQRVIDLLTTRITKEMIAQAEKYAESLGVRFPSQIWNDVVEKFEGYLPLLVQALPDGMWIPQATPFAQVSNTEKGYGELVTWFEAVFLHSSFSSGCATEALHMREYLEKRNLPINRFHSFGFRGHNSLENAYWAGTAWNLFLNSSDDFHTIQYTDNIRSIPATAHKTIQQFDDEKEAYMHSIRETKKQGYDIISLVIDTFDPHNFINNMMQDVLKFAEDNKVSVVLRPDSGDILEQVVLIYNKVKNEFPAVSVIVGEGMSLEKIKTFDHTLESRGIPLSFVSYGIGAGFYKHVDRDHLGFAMKTARANGKDRMKFSMDLIKQSIPGVVNIVKETNGNYTIIPDSHAEDDSDNRGLYREIYKHDSTTSSPRLSRQSWCDIQKIANSQTTQQQIIQVSEQIKEKIKTFRKLYLHD